MTAHSARQRLDRGLDKGDEIVAHFVGSAALSAGVGATLTGGAGALPSGIIGGVAGVVLIQLLQARERKSDKGSNE